MESFYLGSATSTTASVARASKSKLDAAVEGLLPWLVDDGRKSRVPIVLAARDDESSQYRCRCSYQVLKLECTDNASAAGRRNSKLQYAVRRNHQPVPIQATFDTIIANRRIQRAMAGLLTMLNDEDEEGRDESLNCLRTNLTSATFSTSWDECDCVLSMNYCPTVVEPAKWKRQARWVQQQLDLLQVSGRSKNVHLRANEAAEPVCLSDTLVLRKRATDLHSTEWSWNVEIHPTGNNNGDDVSTPRAPEDQSGRDCSASEIVRYEKPESAFYHPNPYVMCRALSWILHRIDVCESTLLSSAGPRPPRRRDLRLLELYCGCGAHTLAILQSSRNSSRRVVAVENDIRLVRALQRNCQLNGIRCSIEGEKPQQGHGEEGEAKEDDRHGASAARALLRVVAQDAGRYVTQLLRRPTSAAPDPSGGYDVMLVDPPKQGLDASVCDFACSHGELRHVLYVSCGREALLRDLQRLAARFQVVDCVLLDLFPGTSAVETLVHLQRRTAS